MHDNPIHAKALYCISMILNAGVWVNNFSIGIKILLGVVASLTTMMAFFNQFKTFQKNFDTWYIVVVVNRVITRIETRKTRNRRIK